MLKEKSKYISLSFIQDECIKCNGICKEIEYMISEMIKEKQIDYMIQDLMKEKELIQLGEEYKACPYIEVPDEIYGKEYKMVDIHFQSGSLIEKVEKMMNTITKNAKENEENTEKLIESVKAVEDLLYENLIKFTEQLDNVNKEKNELRKLNSELRELIKKEELLQIKNDQFDNTKKRLKQVEYILQDNITNKKQKFSEEDKAMLLNELKLKDMQFYNNEFGELYNNKYLISYLKDNIELYCKLGQHDYLKIYNPIRPLAIIRHDKDHLIYIGQVKEEGGCPDGAGIQVWRNGDIREGYWKKGKLNGYGRAIYHDGCYFIGNFKDDKFQGQGIKYNSSGKKYVGEWYEDNKHGQGTEYNQDGSIDKEGKWNNNNFVG